VVTSFCPRRRLECSLFREAFARDARELHCGGVSKIVGACAPGSRRRSPGGLRLVAGSTEGEALIGSRRLRIRARRFGARSCRAFEWWSSRRRIRGAKPRSPTKSRPPASHLTPRGAGGEMNAPSPSGSIERNLRREDRTVREGTPLFDRAADAPTKRRDGARSVSRAQIADSSAAASPARATIPRPTCEFAPVIGRDPSRRSGQPSTHERQRESPPFNSYCRRPSEPWPACGGAALESGAREGGGCKSRAETGSRHARAR